MATIRTKAAVEADITDPPALIRGRAWVWLLLQSGLFAALFGTVIVRMLRIATNGQGETWLELLTDIATTPWNHDWSHAVVVPLISMYFIYQSRHRLAVLPRRTFLPGLGFLFLGVFGFAWSIYPGRNDMLQGYNMILALFGLVLFLVGPAMMRYLWFPICYLFLAVKISDRYWEQIAWRLQLIAAHSATFALQLIGVDATVEGSTISLAYSRDGHWLHEAMNVAEACSGLRMLMAFVALGTAMAYLMNRTWWQRGIMLSLIVPIAVTVNVGRVTVLGILFMTKKSMTTGDFHSFVGMLMLIPAAGLFALVSWVLDKLVIHEPDSQTATARAGNAAKSSDPGGIDPHEPPDQPGHIGPRVASGVAGGVWLTLLMGANYALVLSWLRPELLGDRLGQGMIAGCIVVAVTALLLTCVKMRGVLLRETRGGVPRRPLSMGLTVGVLLAAVLGLNGVVHATRVVLIKQAIPLREPLYRIPERVGEWSMLREDPPLSPESLEVLGTRHYISRVYRDSSPGVAGPGSLARLHVAYYTGTPDTVPHVPDRCFVAGGVRPISTTHSTLSLAGPQYRKTAEGQWTSPSRLNRDGVTVPDMAIPTTVFTFAPGDSPTQRSNVLYFFAANGKYLSTPEAVRLQGFDPRDRYSYYCKIEVGLIGEGDPGVAAQRASAFLSVMLPEIMACLPDWDRINSASESDTGHTPADDEP